MHDKCALVRESQVFVCVGHSVFCIQLPDLSLVWTTIADSSTAFGLYSLEDQIIVHGEQEISKLSIHGERLWQASGSDIFTMADGSCFEILNGVIHVRSWDGRTYNL